MRVVFMGTPDFAVPSLSMLHDTEDVVAVVTQPDRPKGRGHKLAASPVKEKALELGLPVYQPKSVREEDFQKTLQSLKPDIILVVAFGQILPQSILSLPPYGCINVHGSLLPRYRGAAPIQWSVINGEEQAGVTTMYMAKGLDSGDMLLKASLPIQETDTYGDLIGPLSQLGAELLKDTMAQLKAGTLKREPQDETFATYAPMIEKETGHIDWSLSCRAIRSLMHGMDPGFGAWSLMEGDPVKFFDGHQVSESTKHRIGEIISVEKQGFTVQAGDGQFLITSLQVKGGKRMAADAYLRGHGISVGEILE
ncbi:MAG: methionyl-tRNA formyltransferase [Clostridiales bacterium]|nr:methionyl-tRNA formyltransferase [Clostridiales bacterium]